MTVEPGHPYGSLRLGAVVIAVSAAVMVLLGISGPAVASSSSSSAGSMSAGSIVAEARLAMARSGAVSAQGQGTTSIPGVGTATLTESDYADDTSGSQTVMMTSGTKSSAVLPAATTLDVAGEVYANANAPFWTDTVDMGESSATQVAGRWVHIPASSPAFASAAADLTMPSLIQDLFHAKTYRKGGLRTVDGVRAVSVTYQNTGNDAGRATCYVAIGGSHLPVLVIIGGLALHLGSWGKIHPVTPPSGAVPLPSLNSSSASGVPSVA